MAEVTVQIVTAIKDRWGSMSLAYNEQYEGQGAALVEQVDDALGQAVARIREFLGATAEIGRAHV